MKEIISLLVLFWYNLLTRRDLQLEIKKVGNYEENTMVTTIPSGYSWFFISADRLLDKDKFLANFEVYQRRSRNIDFSVYKLANYVPYTGARIYPRTDVSTIRRLGKVVYVYKDDSSMLIYRHKKYTGIFFNRNTLIYHPYYEKYIDQVVDSIVRSVEEVAKELIVFKKASDVIMFHNDKGNLKMKQMPLNFSSYDWKDLNINYYKKQLDKMDAIVDTVSTEKSSINLMFGVPGCGKTAALNYIIHELNAIYNLQDEDEIYEDKGMLYILIIPPSVAEMVGSDAFNNILLDLDAGPNDVPATVLVVIEDSAQLIQNNEIRSRYTSGLLGLVDGIESKLFRNRFHVLLTYNVPEDYHYNEEEFRNDPTIDPAILREGRLKHHIFFRPLMPLKTAAWCKEKGIEPLEAEMPLSSLYSYYQHESSLRGK